MHQSAAPTHTPREDLAHILSPSYASTSYKVTSPTTSYKTYRDSEGITHHPQFSIFPSEEEWKIASSRSSRRGSFESTEEEEERDLYALPVRRGGYFLDLPPSSPSSINSSVLPSSPTTSTTTKSSCSSPKATLHRLFTRSNTHEVYDEDAYWDGDSDSDSDSDSEEERDYFEEDDEEFDTTYQTTYQPATLSSPSSSTITYSPSSSTTTSSSSLEPAQSSTRRRIQSVQLAIQLGLFRTGRKLKDTKRRVVTF